MAEDRPPQWTTELVERALDELERPLAPASEPTPEAAWAHAEAAAVLSSFDPQALRPMRPNPPVDSLQHLLLNSVPVTQDTGLRKWRLRPDVRREALQRLASRAAIRQACEQNPQAAGDSLRDAFLAIAAAPASPEPDTLDYPALLALEEARELLDGILSDLPDAAQTLQATERAALLLPLNALAGSGFRGRKNELAALADYVGVLPAGTIRAIRRSARIALKGHERPPLLVLGPGGIGKSTLLARFILDHIEQDERIIFAYLDFDRPSLSVAEPASILLEAARQIAIQADSVHAPRWHEAHARWTNTLTQAAAGQRSATPVPTDPNIQAQLIGEFAAELKDSFEDTVPFLLVLDTFEEIQYRSREFADSLWQFLDALAQRLPMLRTVLAGRAPLEKRRTETLRLDELDQEAATGYLESHGVKDPQAAELLVQRLGCSPLTLSLAVETMRHDGCRLDSLADVTREQQLFVMSLDRKTAQVTLYHRILDHIHDPAVRAIAHPGLVLRRITPELIRHVLAEPCKLQIETDETARRLFDGLAAEVALVRIGDDGSLIHRSDLRRAMLPLMREDAPDAVRAIHEHAINYHLERDALSDRAEEIYHRLALGEDPAEVDARWQTGVETRLQGAVGELPPAAQTYLAGRIGLEIDPAAWKAASREDIERRIATRAGDLIATARFQDALETLRTVRERQAGSILYLCEARALQALGRFDDALAVIDQALEPAPERGSEQTVLKLLRIAADIEHSRGLSEAYETRAEVAYKLARSLAAHATMLNLAALRLQAWRAQASRDKRLAANMHTRASELAKDLDQLPGAAFASDPRAARIIAAELGAEHPALLARIAESAGLPPLRPDRVRKAIILWNHQVRGRLENDSAALSIMESRDPSPSGAMDVLVGLFARHTLTPGASQSIASELRYALQEQTKDP